MKQYITEQDLDQLSEKAKQKYAEWCFDHGYKTVVSEDEEGIEYDVELMTIGMMIEFLGTAGFDNLYDGTVLAVEELCDMLWSEVKEVLESETT